MILITSETLITNHLLHVPLVLPGWDSLGLDPVPDWVLVIDPES